MGTIRLKNMQFYGYHGVHEFEKEKGGHFEVDVELSADLTDAVSTDDVAKTIDYDSVFKCVQEIVMQQQFNLIETLGSTIADSLLNDYNINGVTVRVRKPEAPIDGTLDTVEVEITKTRAENV